MSNEKTTYPFGHEFSDLDGTLQFIPKIPRPTPSGEPNPQPKTGNRQSPTPSTPTDSVATQNFG